MTPPPHSISDDYQIQIADLESDRPEIIKFWVSHFPEWKTSKYQYFYVDNPDGQAVCWLVRNTGNNEIVGTLAMLQRSLFIDQEPFQAAVAADILVHRDHRRQGLSVALFSALKAHLDEVGIVAVYGTPNVKSEGGAIRAGYERCGTEKRWVRLLRSRGFLRRKLKWTWLSGLLAIPMDFWIRRGLRLETPTGLKASVSGSVDGRVDDLSVAARRQFRIIGGREESWVNWRASECPYRELNFFTLFDRTTEQMVGYVAYQMTDGVAIVFDFLARDLEASSKLIGEFVNYHGRQETLSVDLLYFGNSSIEGMLEANGFVARSDGRPFMLVLPEASVHRDILLDAENWFFTIADNDA